MTVLIVEPGKKPRKAEIDGSLAGMQQVVGGYIQAIYPFEDSVALICNEEGKILGLPLNRSLRDEDGDIYDVIAGTFFLCGAPPGRGSFADLEEVHLKKYQQRFYSSEVFVKLGGKVICLLEKK